jgi:ATP-binding cassette subfamily F protein uup
MNQNAKDFVKLNELTKEQEEVNAQLEYKMERWEYLTELNERIEEEKKK